jgi:hypothetical protein
MSGLEKGVHWHSSIVRIGSGARCDLGDIWIQIRLTLNTI